MKNNKIIIILTLFFVCSIKVVFAEDVPISINNSTLKKYKKKSENKKAEPILNESHKPIETLKETNKKNIEEGFYESLQDALNHSDTATYLYLGSLEKIVDFPRDILKLKNLKELYITHNKIKNIPEDISKLTKLEKLNLCNNEITNLPKSITYLEKLKELEVFGNNIQKIPEEIGNLKNLELLPNQ